MAGRDDPPAKIKMLLANVRSAVARRSKLVRIITGNDRSSDEIIGGDDTHPQVTPTGICRGRFHVWMALWVEMSTYVSPCSVRVIDDCEQPWYCSREIHRYVQQSEPV